MLLHPSTKDLVHKKPILLRATSSILLITTLKDRTLKFRDIKSSIRIPSSSHNIILRLRDLMSNIAQQARHIQRNLRVVLRSSLNGCLNDMISRDVVAQHHIKWCRGAALFLIALNANSIQSITSKQQTTNLIRVSVVVEVNQSIGREQRAELIICQRMRMQGLCFQDHKIYNIDDTDSKRWADFTQDSSSDDNFEGEFGADAHKHDVGVEPVVRGGEFPD